MRTQCPCSAKLQASQAGDCLRRKNPHPKWGGGFTGPKKVCVPEIGLKFPAPLISVFFCLRKNFSDVGRGLGGSAGAGQGPKPPVFLKQ